MPNKKWVLYGTLQSLSACGWVREHSEEHHRHRKNKHVNNRPTYLNHLKKHRAAKVLKVDLPDYDFQRRMSQPGLVSPAEQREWLKKQGVLPPPRAQAPQEKPFYLSSTGAIFDSFVPPEGMLN